MNSDTRELDNDELKSVTGGAGFWDLAINLAAAAIYEGIKAESSVGFVGTMAGKAQGKT